MNDPEYDDAYENNYCYFHRSLEILSKNAEDQCQAMGYSNVAWHIKDEFISNTNAVLETSSQQLSGTQRKMIGKIIKDIEVIPDKILYIEDKKNLQLNNMLDVFWKEIRSNAIILIAELESETKRVNSILNTNYDG